MPFTKSLISSNFTTSAHKSKSALSRRVSTIVNEIPRLTLLEVSDLGGGSKEKSGGIEEMSVMTMMMPGMGVAEKMKKKTVFVFDLKLQWGFDVDEAEQ
ncbi:hypothetical protein KY285_001627 [Solanum tuberosum]|nr:hypothetical protein KY284_009565 [Solanum tuberosum]KAH0730719.1 hypothetical protein KY289_001907 [Solanum tuberosum]KAH0734423.1 hypothetical protein KY285_010130 [Solanum tuberosum]KAH0765756.1 hypothetical protein KY285_001627 [Solanum tuberosum]